MAQAGTVWVDVRGDTSKFIKDVGDAAQTAGRKLSGGLGAGAKTVLSDIGTAAGVSAIGIGAIGGAAVKASTEFNKSMSGVSAVAGATAAELDLLREAALRAGADTVFSASQASQAEAELAKAGVSVSDILGGALAGSLGLAAAGQIDLAQAAEISAQALNIFGLAGDQTTRVADVLAAGANKSAADVAQLGDALRQGGLLAAQTGLTLEETAGVLSLFADNALIGSDAGTSLKTMLQRLAPTTGPAADAMRELGLDFFDAKGAFVGIEEVAAQLQDRLGGLSDEQRQTALTTIFGSDAVRGASILMEGGAAAVEEYTAAVTDQGAAARMAAEQLNNLAGDVEQFKGSVETSLIRIGDLFDGVNRGIVQSGTEVVNVFNDFATTPAWGAIERNINDLANIGGTRLQGLADGLSAALDNISAADVDRVFARIEGGFTRVSEAADGLEPVILGVGAALSSMALRSVPFIGALVPALSPLTGLLGGLVLGSKEGRDALAQLGERASELASGAGVELLESLSNLSGELSDGLVSALSGIGNAAFDAAEVLGPVLADALNELGPPLADLIEAGSELVVNVLPVLAELAGSVLPPAVDVLGAGLTIAADATELLADNLWLLVPAFAAFTAVKYGDQIGKIGTSLRGVADNALFLRDSIGQIATERGVSKLEALRGVSAATGGEMRGLVSSIGGFNLALVGVTAAVTVGAAVYETWANNIAEVRREGEQLFDDLLAGADVQARIAQQLNDAFDREGSRDDFEQTGLSIAAVSKIINDNAGDIDQFRQDWNDAGKSLIIFRREGEQVPEGIRPIIDTLFALADTGALTGEELQNIVDVLTDVDKNARDSAEGLAYQGDQFEKIIPKAQQTAAVLRDLAIAQDPTAGIDAQQAALQRLTAQFPELAATAGIGTAAVADGIDGIGSSAQAAVGQLRALASELEEFSGATRDVDEAQRDFNDSINGVLESVGRNGNGIDINTEAGRRNAESIQQMVEAGERLAETQALTDRTGKTSALTFRNIQDQLGALYEANVLNADEYGRLIELYGLTPDDVSTKVVADTAEAEQKFDELQWMIDSLTNLSEEDRVNIQAEIDAGNYDGVRALLLALAADQESTVTVDADIEPAETKVADLHKLIPILGMNSVPVDADTTQAEADLDGLSKFIPLFGGAVPVDADTSAAEAKLAALARSFPVFGIEGAVTYFPKPSQTGGVEKRAKGGDIRPAAPYLVGEEGPELIVPRMAGTVIPAAETASMLNGPMADSKQQAGTEFSAAMLAELQSVAATNAAIVDNLGRVAAAVASARPITISAAEPRRTAEQLVVHESRLLRSAGV